MKKPNMSPGKTGIPIRAHETRISNFDEVIIGYTEELALEEASRCLNCSAQYCKASCPVHTPVPEFIAKIRERDFEGAYQLITSGNVFPAMSGRLCAQENQCEKNCTRGIKGEPVAIGWLERYVADRHHEQYPDKPSKPEPNGQTVAIVGSGPAGLTCAGELARKGYRVSVFESKTFLGGTTVFGIPQFVLPYEIVADQVDRLKELGVSFHTHTSVGKEISIDDLFGQGFGAVFLATGATKPIELDITGAALPQVYSSTEYLTYINVDRVYLYRNSPLNDFRCVAVIGGGNAAVDVSRSARRMGAEKVYLIYNGTRDNMTARREEIDLALDEGVELHMLTAPIRILGEEKVTGIECVRLEVTDFDCPEGPGNETVITDSCFVLNVDAVIVSIGHTSSPVPGVSLDENGHIAVGEDGVSTSKPGVFAGGDAVSGAATFIQAMGAGKRGAAAIDGYLQKNTSFR